MRILGLIVCLILSLSSGASAGIIHDISRSAMSTITRAYLRFCAYSPSGCASINTKIGIHITGGDGSVNITAAYNGMPPWNFISNHSLTHVYAGTSIYASGSGPTQLFRGGGSPGTCSMSCGAWGCPSSVDYTDNGWPLDCNYITAGGAYVPSSWSDLGSPACSSGQLVGQYSATASGSLSGSFSAKTCLTIPSFSGYEIEFGTPSFVGGIYDHEVYNRDVYRSIVDGYSAMLNSDDPFLSTYANNPTVLEDLQAATSYLRDGIDVSSSIGALSTFDSPWASFIDSPSSTPVYITGISSITVNLAVASSVTLDVPGLDSLLSQFSTSTDSLAEYDEYISTATYHYSVLSSGIETIVGYVSSVFDFDGITMWDGCFTFNVGDVNINGSTIDEPPSVFCLSSLPGWDSMALPLLRALLMLSTFVSCLWWLFD
jgi:hypothetical protein